MTIRPGDLLELRSPDGRDGPVLVGVATVRSTALSCSVDPATNQWLRRLTSVLVEPDTLLGVSRSVVPILRLEELPPANLMIRSPTQKLDATQATLSGLGTRVTWWPVDGGEKITGRAVSLRGSRLTLVTTGRPRVDDVIDLEHALPIRSFSSLAVVRSLDEGFGERTRHGEHVVQVDLDGARSLDDVSDEPDVVVLESVDGQGDPEMCRIVAESPTNYELELPPDHTAWWLRTGTAVIAVFPGGEELGSRVMRVDRTAFRVIIERPSGSNRRRADRVPIRIAVGWTAGSLKGTGTSVDLTIQGIRFETFQDPPPVGATLRLVLRLPGQPLLAQAIVRGIDDVATLRFGNKHEVRAELLGIGTAEASLLAALVERAAQLRSG